MRRSSKSTTDSRLQKQRHRHLLTRKNLPQKPPQSEMVQLVEVPQVEFLARVAKLPVVSSAMGYAADTYGKAKESSPNLIQRTLSTAEDTVKYAAFRALPVVQTLERPIHAVDSLACRTLDRVEENLPIMKKTPDEILTSTRSYVTEKWQPVHNQVESVYGVVAMATDRILNNSLGRFAMGSIETTVSICQDCIDYYLPPLTTESPKEFIPEKPSQKLAWSVRQAFALLIKVQNRLTVRVQHSLHDLGLDGLLYTGALISLFEWVQINWKDIEVMGFPTKFRHLIDFCRSQGEKSLTDVNSGPLADAVFLATFLTKRMINLIRTAIDSVSNLPEYSGALKMLRLRLELVLESTTHFAARLLQVANPRDLMDRANQFLSDNFTSFRSLSTPRRSRQVEMVSIQKARSKEEHNPSPSVSEKEAAGSTDDSEEQAQLEECATHTDQPV